MSKIIHCFNSKEILYSLIEFFESEDSVLIVTAESSRVSPSILEKLELLKCEFEGRVYINYVDLMYNKTIFHKAMNRIKKYLFVLDIMIKYGLRNNDLYVFNTTIIYEVLKFRSRVFLLEHGNGTYADRTESWKGERLFNNSFCGGLSRRFHCVLLQKPELASKSISSKVKKYDIYAKFQKLDVKYKRIINDIFSLDLSIEYKNILITQHFSESGYFSEREKVDLYRKIVREFNLQPVSIKPHPRETTNYDDYFHCNVIDKFLPFELLILNDVFIDNVVTITSSVGFIDSSKTKIHVLGSLYDKRIYNEDTRIEKENKFINVNKEYNTLK